MSSPVLSTQDIDPSNPNPRRFFLLRWLVNVWHWVLPPDAGASGLASRLARVVCARGYSSPSAWRPSFFAALYAKPIQDAYQVWQADRYLLDAKRYLDDKDIAQRRGQRAEGAPSRAGS